MRIFAIPFNYELSVQEAHVFEYQKVPINKQIDAQKTQKFCFKVYKIYIIKKINKYIMPNYTAYNLYCTTYSHNNQLNLVP